MSNLNRAQREVIEFYNGSGVPVQWFEGFEHDDGTIEVIALGDHFIWSFLIAEDGTYHSSEATVGDFSTGVEF